MYRLLAEDIIKFHKIIEEHQFLINHDFKTEGDVLNFLSESKSEIAELTEARRMLRNELKRAVRAENTDETKPKKKVNESILFDTLNCIFLFCNLLFFYICIDSTLKFKIILKIY